MLGLPQSHPYQDIRIGNDDGPFVEPGKPQDSFLFQIAAHLEEPDMPPAKNKVGANNLRPEELGLLKLWITQGAKGEMRAAEPLVWKSYRRETPPIYAVAAGPHGRFAAAGRGNLIHLYDVVTGCAGNSWMFENRVQHVLDGNYEPLSTVEIFVKDLGLVLETGKEQRFPLPLAAAAHQQFLAASAAGYGHEDDAAVIKVYRDLAGLQLPIKEGSI